jgi:hypothetical protein
MNDARLGLVTDIANIHETALMAATQWAMSDESRSGLNLGISPEKFGQAIADVYVATAKQLIAASRSEVAS